MGFERLPGTEQTGRSVWRAGDTGALCDTLCGAWWSGTSCERPMKVGGCLSSPKRSVEDEKVVFWLIEAMLGASGSDATALAALLNSAALFPFEMGL